MLWIRVKLDYRSVLIGVCYRPPHVNRTEFNISLYHVIGTVTKNFPSDHCFLAGDFNYPEINWSTLLPFPNYANSRQCTEFLSIISVFGLHQMITTATRNNAILDLFFSTNPECVTSISTMESISDHALIHIQTSQKVNRSANIPKQIFVFSRANNDGMTAAILNFERYYMSSHDERTASENWLLIKNMFIELLHTFVPKTAIPSDLASPWFTNSLKRMLNKKKRLFLKAKRLDDFAAWSSYRFHSKLCKSEVKKAKLTFFFRHPT